MLKIGVWDTPKVFYYIKSPIYFILNVYRLLTYEVQKVVLVKSYFPVFLIPTHIKGS